MNGTLSGMCKLLRRRNQTCRVLELSSWYLEQCFLVECRKYVTLYNIRISFPWKLCLTICFLLKAWVWMSHNPRRLDYYTGETTFVSLSILCYLHLMPLHSSSLLSCESGIDPFLKVKNRIFCIDLNFPSMSKLQRNKAFPIKLPVGVAFNILTELPIILRPMGTLETKHTPGNKILQSSAVLVIWHSVLLCICCCTEHGRIAARQNK